MPFAFCLSLLLPAPADAAKKKAKSEGAWFGGVKWVEFHENVPPPVPTAAQAKDGFILFRRSVLERIYQFSNPRPTEIPASIALQAALDEYEPVQLAIAPLRDLKQVRVTVSDLTDGAKHVIPSSEVSVRMVRYYAVRLSIRVKDLFGVVPKTLEPAVPLDLGKDAVRPYWITVHVPEQQAGGLYKGTITVEHAGGGKTLDLTVDVIPVKLREPDILYGTLSINALAHAGRAVSRGGDDDDPATSAALSPRAQELLREADLIIRDQREHGMNTINPRSDKEYMEKDGHPYLPDLELGIELYKKYHFTKPMVYFPVNLLKTNKINRSSNYREYDPAVHVPMARKIAAYYTKRFREEGLPGIMFVPVEEPNLKSGIRRLDAKDTRQKMAIELTKVMKEAGATMAMTCTPESVVPVRPYLDYWIMAFKRFTPKAYEMAQQAHAKLGIYANNTMMGQNTYFTRFLFGYFAWANDLKGMLPWTYPMQPNRFPGNRDNKGEGGLNVHNGFLGIDGKPIPTIQWELSRDGIDDAKYLVTIAALAAGARASGAPAAVAAAVEADRFLASVRAAVSKDVRQYFFEDEATLEPTASGGWDAAKFDGTRAQSAEILKKLVAAQG